MARECKNVSIEIVTEQECVKLTCDLCGKEADCPNDSSWEYCGGRGGATLESCYTIDGDIFSDELDLCIDCAKGLIDLIKRKRLVVVGTTHGLHHLAIKKEQADGR